MAWFLLICGVLVLTSTIISIWSGESITDFDRSLKRTERPIAFWLMMLWLSLLAGILLGLGVWIQGQSLEQKGQGDVHSENLEKQERLLS